MRVPGDTIFFFGAVALVWFVLGLKTGLSFSKADDGFDPPDEDDASMSFGPTWGEALTEAGGIQNCGKAGNCQAVCPKDIPLMHSWGHVNRAATIHAIKRFFDG